MWQISCVKTCFRRLNIQNKQSIEKRIKSYELEQFIDSKKSLLMKKLFVSSSNLNDQLESVEMKTHSSAQIVKSRNENNLKTSKLWTFRFRQNESYEQCTQARNDLMKLICLNFHSKRMSKTWLRFDMKAHDYTVSIFVNSETSHCFFAQRIVNQLKLKLQQFFDKMRLKSDKIVSIIDFTQITWSKKKFHIIINCKMLDMKNDFILNENFWQNYRLCFDYDTFDCKITNKKEKHLLHDMNFDRSRLQMLNNEFSEMMSRRAFEKFIRKNAKCYFYVVRDMKFVDIEIVKAFEELASL